MIPARYQAGVQRAKWAEAAGSDQAEQNYAARMQQVISQKLRQAGVRRVGDETWRTAAIQKGAPVIAQRLQQALPKWQQNFGTVYQAVVQTVQALPPRTIDPFTNIDQRLRPVVEAAVKNRVRGRMS
jgi:predicted alpha-1,6-mannanase (GH76 family)